MRFLTALWLAFVLVALGAGPAAADPGSLIIGFTALAGTATGALVAAGINLGVSRLVGALRRQPESRSAGIRTEVTLEGGLAPQSFVLGTTATAGHLNNPPYAEGEDGDVDNAYRWTVLSLSDMPIERVSAVWIDGDRFEVVADFVSSGLSVDPQVLQPNPATKPKWTEDGGSNDRDLRFRWYDGRQTAADWLLTDRFAGHPERPWGADRIGRGVAYAWFRFRYNTRLFRGEPRLKFEVEGIRLYDPRKDSSVGGSGPQRWGDPSTWAFSANPEVMKYNVLRGIPVYRRPDGTVIRWWGYRLPADRLPLASWIPAMDVCDQVVDGAPRFRAGTEVRMATAEFGGDTPAAVLDLLNTACDGQLSEVGGVWYTQCGGPGLPVAHITQGDALSTEAAELTPFQGLDETHNAVRLSHPRLDLDWEVKEAQPLYDEAAAAEDGRVLMADLRVPAVPYPAQIARLGAAFLKDARRMRRLVVTLSRRFAHLRPLQTVTVTWPELGFEAKLFEVTGVTMDLQTLEVRVGLRERDPADYVPSGPITIPDAPSTVVRLPGRAPLPGFDADPVAVLDALGQPRRAGILLTWPGTLSGVRAIIWQIEIVATAAPAPGGSTANVQAGQAIVTEGILPETTYRVRARGDATDWSGWVTLTTPAAALGLADLDAALRGTLAFLDETVDGLVEDVSLLELRGDQSLEDQAEAQLLTLLYARQQEDGRAADLAYVQEEYNALITAEREAITQVRQEQGSAIDDLQATVLTETQTRASETQALALSVQQLSTQAGQTIATVETQAVAIATLEGYAAASLSFRVGAGSASGSVELVASDDPEGPAVSGVTIKADLIRLSGTSQIDNAVIGHLNLAGYAVAYKNVFTFRNGPNAGQWRPGTTPSQLVGKFAFRRWQGYRTKIVLTCSHGAAGTYDRVFDSSVAYFEIWRTYGGVRSLAHIATATSGQGGFSITNVLSFVDEDTRGNGAGQVTTYEIRVAKAVGASGQAASMFPHLDNFVLEVEHFRRT